MSVSKLSNLILQCLSFRFVRRELAKNRQEASKRWNYDFDNDRPTTGRYERESVTGHLPQFTRLGGSAVENIAPNPERDRAEAPTSSDEARADCDRTLNRDPSEQELPPSDRGGKSKDSLEPGPKESCSSSASSDLLSASKTKVDKAKSSLPSTVS